MADAIRKLLLALTAAMLAAFAPAHGADLVLRAAAGPYVEAEIGGARLRLKVEFDHAPGISLNPEAVARARLGRGDGKWIQQIGPVKLPGRRAKVRLLLAGAPTRADVRWHDRAVSADADGAVSINVLPFESVTLERRRPQAQERDLAFRTKLHDNHGVYIPIRAGRRRIAARLSFSLARTTAPAAASAALSEHLGGVLGAEKSYEEISLGVLRPVWPLRLERPLDLGGLTVRTVMARATDFRGDHRLARHTEPAAGQIVVNGERPSQDALYRITVGLDVLGRCSAATYRRATGMLRLRCSR